MESRRRINHPGLVDQVPRRVTIRDVAQAANVGVGTISRVLNSSPKVSSETRTRVLDAMKRMRFRPNALARRVRPRQVHLVDAARGMQTGRHKGGVIDGETHRPRGGGIAGAVRGEGYCEQARARERSNKC